MTLAPRRGRDIRPGDMLLRYQSGQEVFAHVHSIEEANSRELCLGTSLGYISLYKFGVYSIVCD